MAAGSQTTTSAATTTRDGQPLLEVKNRAFFFGAIERIQIDDQCGGIDFTHGTANKRRIHQVDASNLTATKKPRCAPGASSSYRVHFQIA